MSEAGKSSPRWRLAGPRWWVVGAACLTLYAGLIAWHMGAYGGASDSSGYLNNARGLRDGKVLVDRRVLSSAPADELSGWVYVPVGFVGVGHAKMAPAYPFGLPLLVVAVSWVSGWDLAPHLTMWLHALLGLAVMFLLARQARLSMVSAIFGTVVLAISPLYLHMAVQLMSDVVALVWTSAAVLFAWHSRTRASCALLAGVALGIAVLTRPTNVLVFPAVLMATGFDFKRWALLLLGGVPAAIALAALNHAAFGNAFGSGYGDISLSFGVENGAKAFCNYCLWLPVFLTPWIAMAVLSARRITWPVAVNLVWSAAFVAFYAFYSFTHEDHWSLRFLLPAFPPLLVLALRATEDALKTWPFVREARHRSVAVWVSGLLLGAWALGWNAQLSPFKVRNAHRDYIRVSEWANGHLPAGAVIVAMQMTGALYHYTGFTLVRWDQLTPQDAAVIERAAAREGRPIFAILYDYERDKALNEKMPGDWTKLATVRQTTIWRRPAARSE